MVSKNPRRTLSLVDAICIIVGTIIGAGVFGTVSDVAKLVPNPVAMVGLWVVAGGIVLVGAACFVELTSRFPDESGGDYAYLKRAFGNEVAFMFAWAAFWIVRPANIGIMATLFGIHFGQIISGVSGLGGVSDSVVKIGSAIVAVAVLTATNLLGLRNGKLTQNLLTVTKVVGIGGIILLALVTPEVQSTTAVTASWKVGSIWVALVLVMFSFGGWNDVAFIANEIKEPRRNLWRCLVYGVAIVTLVYVAFNIALAVGIGQGSMAASESPAITLVKEAFGGEGFFANRAQELVAALICISCLGAVNGMIITSPRIYFAVGCDYRQLRFLSGWDYERNCPWQALLMQAVITMLLILLCVKYDNIFKVLLISSAPFFWSFLGVTVMSLLVFRKRDKSENPPDHFLLPLFPVEPIFFALVCAGLTVSSINHLIDEGYQVIALSIGGMMLVGVVLGFVLKANETASDDGGP